MNENKVLVTGGHGFLGSDVLRRLPAAVAPTSVELDLRNASAVESYLEDTRPEVVVHLAARVGGIFANLRASADFLVDNLRMDANLLSALRRHPPRHLLVMLSTCMYPDRLADDAYPMGEELIEAGPPPPSNAAYAVAKRALWHGVRALHAQYGVPYTALVPSNLYGPGDHFDSPDSHFLAACVHKIEQARKHGHRRVEFFGSGIALRQYLCVEDLAALVVLLVARGPLGTTLNVAPQFNASIRELCETVADEAGYGGEIVFTGDGPDGQLRKDVSADRLLQRVPEWQNMETPLREGLRRTIEWYREHVAAG